MIQGIIGKKIGMTQVFGDDGRVVPVTVIQAGPCLVVQKKVKQNNPWIKIQLGLVEDKKVKRVTKPMRGHFEKAGVPPTKILKEFFVNEEDKVDVGDSIKVDIFAEKDLVNVAGVTKGKGFQGVMRRFNFSGGRATHGSMFHRRVGSIGNCTYPAEVEKGKGMPGRMGGKRAMVRHLRVIKVDIDNHLLWIKGAVPGFNGNVVFILKESFKRR